MKQIIVVIFLTALVPSSLHPAGGSSNVVLLVGEACFAQTLFVDWTHPLKDFIFYTGGCICWMISYTPDYMISSLIWLAKMTKSD